MNNNDIFFKNEESNIMFNFRVALIPMNKDKILLQKPADEDNYILIGGKVKYGEDSKTAIIRETKEETGIELKSENLKLLKIVENFFTYNYTKIHEILFIYKVNSEELNKMNNFYTLDKENVLNKWYDVNDIKTMDLRPDIVKECYNDENVSVEIINR